MDKRQQYEQDGPCRIALGVEYNGNVFNGFQAQKSPRLTTVQEELETALSGVADHPVRLICAGRTDTGVHATAQVVHFDCPRERPLKAWVRGVNALTSRHLSVRWARSVDDDFHARFSALSRRYRYVIHNHPVPPAILHGLVTAHYNRLDESAMEQAGRYLLGEHDFSSFRGAGCQSRSPFRNLTSLAVSRRGDYVIVDVEANAFLFHMVRNIVGSLLEVGEGRRPPEWMRDVLQGRDRRISGITAKADGLYLTGVTYPARFGLPESGEGPPFLLV